MNREQDFLDKLKDLTEDGWDVVNALREELHDMQEAVDYAYRIITKNATGNERDYWIGEAESNWLLKWPHLVALDELLMQSYESYE